MSSVKQRRRASGDGTADAATASASAAAASDAVLSAYSCPLNTRLYIHAADAEHRTPAPLTWLESLVAMSTMLIYCGGLQIILTLFVGGLVLRSTAMVGAALALVATVFLPAKRWDGLLESWMAAAWLKYHNFSVVCQAHLQPGKKYIFGESPHGVMPLGPMLAGFACHKTFPGNLVNSVAASSVFSTPLYKHFTVWQGAYPASKKSFLKAIDDSVGGAGVVVGGISEMYMQEPDRERIRIATRLGFVKVALEAGVDLVPVYHFGNTKLINIIGRSLEGLSRKLRASLLLPYGRFGLPIPFRRDIMMVMGRPVPVKQMSPDDAGFEEEAKRLHAQYLQHLTEAYDRYKGLFGWEDVPLSIE